MSNDPIFNIASIDLCTGALGPYKRMSIWFQGCNLGCEGCCNPELQPFEPRHMMRLSSLVDIAKRAVKDNGIEGVTFIGGEPTLQCNLHLLAEALDDMGLGIILFTGRRCEDLEPDLLEYVDLVIDGRFDINDRDLERNLVGSRNQRIIELTDRYKGNDWFMRHRDDYIEMDLSLGDGMLTARGNVF